jgi:hypothetical protein
MQTQRRTPDRACSVSPTSSSCRTHRRTSGATRRAMRAGMPRFIHVINELPYQHICCLSFALLYLSCLCCLSCLSCLTSNILLIMSAPQVVSVQADTADMQRVYIHTCLCCFAYQLAAGRFNRRQRSGRLTVELEQWWMPTKRVCVCLVDSFSFSVWSAAQSKQTILPIRVVRRCYCYRIRVVQRCYPSEARGVRELTETYAHPYLSALHVRGC